MLYVVYYPHLSSKTGIPDEVKEQIIGLTESTKNISNFNVLATDGKYTYSVKKKSESYSLHIIEKFLLWNIITSQTIVHFHGGLIIKCMSDALLLHLFGVKIYLSPCSQLSDELKACSWRGEFVGLNRLFRTLTINIIRFIWISISGKIICLSSHEADSSHIPIKKRIICPWPTPHTALSQVALKASLERKKSGNKVKITDNLNLAYIGRFSLYPKGLDILNESIKDIGNDVRIFLYTPPLRLETRQNIEFSTYFNDAIWDTETHGAGLYKHLQQLDAVVNLSRWDGQPRALREAMLCDCFTLSTKESHFSDIHDEFGTGVTVASHTIDALISSIEKLKQFPKNNLIDLANLAMILFDRINIGHFMYYIAVDDMSKKAEDNFRYNSYYKWIKENLI